MENGPVDDQLTPSLFDVTQVEIAIITRRILVRFNNDATACFDRIMPHILCLCLRSYQMPAEFTGLLGDLLRYAKYAIKTANGVSKDTYSHSSESPVFGSGQGTNTIPPSVGVSSSGWNNMEGFDEIVEESKKEKLEGSTNKLEQVTKMNINTKTEKITSMEADTEAIIEVTVMDRMWIMTSRCDPLKQSY